MTAAPEPTRAEFTEDVVAYAVRSTLITPDEMLNGALADVTTDADAESDASIVSSSCMLPLYSSESLWNFPWDSPVSRFSNVL